MQIGVLDNLLHVVFHERVHDVEEVGSIRQPSFRELGREILHEVLRVLHVSPQFFHRKLVIHRHVDAFYLVQLHQRLRPSKDFFEKVLVPTRDQSVIDGSLTSCIQVAGTAAGCHGSTL